MFLDWASRLARNFIGYAIVIIPLMSLVWLLKSNSRLGATLNKWKLFRVLAFGRQEWQRDDTEALSRLQLREDGAQRYDDEEISTRKQSATKVSPVVDETSQVTKERTAVKWRSVLWFVACFTGLNLSYVLWGASLAVRILTTIANCDSSKAFSKSES